MEVIIFVLHFQTIHLVPIYNDGIVECDILPLEANTHFPRNCVNALYVLKAGPYTYLGKWVALVIRYKQLPIASVGWSLAPGVRPEA